MITDKRRKQIDSILSDWGYWASKRSDYAEISKATGQIHCSSLFHLTQGQLEQVENTEHRKRYQLYPDHVLQFMDVVIRSMPRKVRKAIIAAYRWSDRIPTAEKLDMLKVAKSTYYDRIERGFEIINGQFNFASVN